jgi:hypothetical protein
MRAVVSKLGGGRYSVGMERSDVDIEQFGGGELASVWSVVMWAVRNWGAI